MKTNLLTTILCLISMTMFGRDYTAKVLEIYDGDSFHCDIELGLKVHVFAMVRMRNINAPEMHTGKSGEDSKQALKKMIEGKIVKLSTKDNKEFEKYGRVLAIVTVEGLEKSVNELMVEQKQAVPFMED